MLPALWLLAMGWMLVAVGSLDVMLAAERPREKPSAIPLYQQTPVGATGISAGSAPQDEQLSRADREVFARAHAAADRDDWTSARFFAAQGGNAIGRDLIEWRYVTDMDSPATFAEVTGFAERHPHWPRQNGILSRAERALPIGYDASQIVAWFGKREPLTREGRLRLGAALLTKGDLEAGAKHLRVAWIDGDFSVPEEAQFLQRHGKLIRGADHEARFERLFKLQKTSEASRQALRLKEHERSIARARLRVRTQGIGALTAELAKAAESAPRLRLEQARALRLADRDREAWQAMLAIPPDALGGDAWLERHIEARDALKAGRADIAYRLAAGHGLSAGAEFADAEFLAGWVALRRLSDPERAAKHFRTLLDRVTLPISRARAAYWLARSSASLGRSDEAVSHFRTAASYPTTFYGQLALTEIERTPQLGLTTALLPEALVPFAFAENDVFRAVQILDALGQRVLLRIFALHAAGEARDPAYFGALAAMLTQGGDLHGALRLAKAASYRGVILLPQLAPLIDVPRRGPEPSLILGLVRQESEFDPAATSTAGAKGFMQLMPGTAARIAKSRGISHRAERLTDAKYNLELGTDYLAELLKRWNGSYVLAIASYNAGPANVQRWIAAYGDPRERSIDPLDWLELIPFGETRNYVQRVLESVQIYRSRLAASGSELRLAEDLRRPNGHTPSVLVQNDSEPDTALNP